MSDETTPDNKQPTARDPQSLMDTEAAAKWMDQEVSTLEAWRLRGGGPPFVKISRRSVKYRLCDLIKWSESRLRTSTSDSGDAA